MQPLEIFLGFRITEDDTQHFFGIDVKMRLNVFQVDGSEILGLVTPLANCAQHSVKLRF